MKRRRITQDELEVFLRKHKLWLVDVPGGEQADLTGADLTGANLTRANLTRAVNVNYPIACPEKGSFTGFKKVRGNYVVELEIPADALRSSAILTVGMNVHLEFISLSLDRKLLIIDI